MSQYWTVLGCVIILWGVFLLDGGVSDYGLICHVPLLYVLEWRQGGGRVSENGGNPGKKRVRIPRRESKYPLKGAEILGFLLLALDRFPNYSPIHNGPWPPTMQP